MDEVYQRKQGLILNDHRLANGRCFSKNRFWAIAMQTPAVAVAAAVFDFLLQDAVEWGQSPSLAAEID